MSISTIQKKRKTKEFYEMLVKQGIEPNNYEMNKMLTEYFDVHTLGMPSYTPILQKPYEESNKDDYNHNFSTLGEDLETIYEANVETNNKAVAMQQYYDLEKNKIRNEISKLNLRIKNIADALKSSSNIKQYVQVFDDLYDIDFYGNKERNIPYTTSFVDLLQKKVYTDKANVKANKISLDNAQIEIQTNGFRSTHTQGNKEKILTDTINDLYILYGYSDKDKAASLSIVIDIGSIVSFNTVTFKFSSTKEMRCELYVSENGTDYLSVYDVTNRDFIEWNFNSVQYRYVKIVCHKDEPDGMIVDNEDNNFGYYFILKNISILKETFESKSVFVSKSIEFNDLTHIIKLDATENIFNNTRIDYFIGYDNGISKIGWDAIENHKEHTLFMFNKVHKILNRHVNSDFGLRDSELELYKLYELPSNINTNSIKLTAGYNAWSVRKYDYVNGSAEETGFSLSTSDFSDFVSNCTMTQLFMDCDNYDAFRIQSNTLYIFTQYVQVDSPQYINDTFINVVKHSVLDSGENVIDNVEGEVRVFLNGYEIMPSDNNKYTFALKTGVSKIQIAVYASSLTVEDFYLYHNINFKSVTNDCFAYTPMKYANCFTLNNMIGDTYEYYTIKDGWVCVKCNPNDIITSSIEDMGYYLTFSALRTDMEHYFKNNCLKFRIMAVLSSTDKNVSPELINFRITGK